MSEDLAISERQQVYVVVEGGRRGGDVYGSSVTAERIWFSHVSSGIGWLVRDTTTGFTDRREALEAAYPEGLDVVVVEHGEEMPAEIAHHYEPAA